jgi:hypothetical protein
MEIKTDKISSDNFTKTFNIFERELNALFHRTTQSITGGNIREPKNSYCYIYTKQLKSKTNLTIEIDVLYDKMKEDYIYYNYNLFFNNNKLMFHFEPTHKEHFQPHINVYVEGKELQNLQGEGIHIISHKYHPFEILSLIKRYFVRS